MAHPLQRAGVLHTSDCLCLLPPIVAGPPLSKKEKKRGKVQAIGRPIQKCNCGALTPAGEQLRMIARSSQK